MAQKVYSIVSQKGGVSKSILGFALAERLAPSGSTVLCDTDFPQFSMKLLAEVRAERSGDALTFDVAACKDTGEVGRKAQGYQNVVIDGAPHASQDTYHYAKYSDVILLPTRTAILDLTPNIELARDLEARGIPRDKMVFVITQSPSKTDTATARDILEGEGWAVLEQDLHFAGSYTTYGDRGRSINDIKHPSLKYKVNRIFAELLRR